MESKSVCSTLGLFAQLAPLVSRCAVLLIVSGEAEGRLRVNVCPRQRDKEENDALTTPLSVIGTPEELDASLVDEVSRFVEIHQGLRSNLGLISAEIAEAEKAAREEAGARVAKRHAKASAAVEAKKAGEAAKPEVRAQGPATMSLFDPPTGSEPQAECS